MAKRLTIALVLVFLASFKLMPGGQAYAQAAGPQGITISPAYQQVSIQGGDAQKPIPLSITNDKSTPQTLKITFSDFNTLNETGGLFFVGANPTQLQQRYGLTKWISITPSQITLQPKQTMKLQAIVQNLPTLASGGHYGAINVEVVTGASQPGSSSIAVHPVASSLIFLTKVGGDTHKLSLANVYVKHSLFSLPTDVILRFHNDGNTHLIPRGAVTITKTNGQLVSKGIINQDSDIILPQNFRQYPIELQPASSTLKVGKYNLQVDFRFDGINQYRAYQVSFWYVPIANLIIGLAILILLGTGAWLGLKRIKHN